MTRQLYLHSSSLQGMSKVVSVTDNLIELEETLFHPQGGGQKGDKGYLNQIKVTDVKKAPAGIVHIVESAHSLQVGDSVDMKVDPEWRRINSAHHSGGHLIASVLQAVIEGVTPIGGHHWPGEARIECKLSISAEIDLEDLKEKLELGIAQEIDRATLFKIEMIDNVRHVKIGSTRGVPCGGTHVSSAADLKTLTIAGLKVKKGKLRISYSV